MASDGQHESGALSRREANRIAEAFELAPDKVLEDADFVARWQEDEHVLRGLIQERHGWDASIPHFYILWLRGDGAGPHD